MGLSDVFKFTQGLGQRGHQIGRKVGDAVELLTLGMISLNEELKKYLVIENGVEGATTAEHKVEFAFYNLNNEPLGTPIPTPDNLFGIIECKKVGVEQTIKQSFKTWLTTHRGDFYRTGGYSFAFSSWRINIVGEQSEGNNMKVVVTSAIIAPTIYHFACVSGSQILLAIDDNNQLFVLGPGILLSTVERSIDRCIVVEIKEIDVENNIKKINVNDALSGPQTPEKAKQASFVSLDVRKRVLGHFDKTEDKSFVSILVIAEAAHWETKSRNMIRLCNDTNLIVACNIIVHFFELCAARFGNDYQELITKRAYVNNPLLRAAVTDTINNFDRKILQDMETLEYVHFTHVKAEDGSNRLVVAPLTEE